MRLLILLLLHFAASLHHPPQPHVPHPPPRIHHDPPKPPVTVWPQPQSLLYSGDVSLFVDITVFSICTSSTSSLLQRAIDRYTRLIFPFDAISTHADCDPLTCQELTKLEISTLTDDEDLLWNTDSSYTLDVRAPVAKLYAPSVFGALYGLESFSQLVKFDVRSDKYLIANSTITIVDNARFRWRGLLIDSSRHFLPVSELRRLIDSLSYAKMNVLHWHITDSESFPLEVTLYPALCRAGAYSPIATYPRAVIRALVKYAKDRGVRLLPEIDMPGHSYSWGIGYPYLTANCTHFQNIISNVPCFKVALDPSKKFTYDVISAILLQLNEDMPDGWIHIGGDEVNFGCWMDDAHIVEWMQKEGLGDGVVVEQFFYERIMKLIDALPNARNVIVWQEVFDSGLHLYPQNTVIQAWKTVGELSAIVKAGYHAILSAGWYLDLSYPGKSANMPWQSMWQETWKDFYAVEPSTEISPSAMDHVLGGEACMWGARVDINNIESFVWPRTAAVAERLWSPVEVNDIKAATPRLVDFRCRLSQRGILAGPISSDYCPLPSDYNPH